MRSCILILLAGFLSAPAFAQHEPPKSLSTEPVAEMKVVEAPSVVAATAEGDADDDAEIVEAVEEAERDIAGEMLSAELAKRAQNDFDELRNDEEAQDDPTETPSAALGDSRLPSAEELIEMGRLEADLDPTEVALPTDLETLERQAQFRDFVSRLRDLEVVATLQAQARDSIGKLGALVPSAKRHRVVFSREGMMELRPVVSDPAWSSAVGLFESGKCKDALAAIKAIPAEALESAEARYGVARMQMCGGASAEGRKTLQELATGKGVVAMVARARLGLKDDSEAKATLDDEEGQYLSQLISAARTHSKKNLDGALTELDSLHDTLKVPWDKYRVRLAQAEMLESSNRIDEAGAAYLDLYRKTRGWKVNDTIEDRIETLERKHKKSFLSFGERIDRMRHLVARGRYKEAKQVSIENAKIRKVGGKEVAGWTKFRMALQAEREKDRTKSVKLFEEADRLVKDSEVRPRIYFGWARALRRTNHDSDAISLYERLCVEYPDQELCEESTYEAGRLLQYQDKHEAALAKFSAVIKADRDGGFVADALWRSAFSHYLTGNWASSITNLERLRKDFGDLRDESELTLGLKATYWIGVAHLKAGERDQARRVLQDTINQGMLTWYGRLAASRMKAEGWKPDVRMPEGQLTASDLEDLASLMVPENPRLESAGLLVRLGFFQEALKELRTQVAVHPVPEGANKMLAAVHLARGDASSAHWAMKKFIDEAGPNEMTLRDWGTAFPLAYMELAHRYGVKAGVSPFLVQAIMRQESGFRAGVKSWAGAVGLMQLMPGTANWTAKTFMESSTFKRNDLLDPEKNVRLGSMYIRVHTAHSMNQVSLALAGYNAGAGALESWFKRYGDRDVDAFVESITYQEARGYVRKVMTSYITYTALYGGELLEIPLKMPAKLGKWGVVPEVDADKNISSLSVDSPKLARK